MQPIEIPKFPILRGEEAIETLYDFIDELKERRGKELTDKQTNALVKVAEGLISSIEAETRFHASDTLCEEMHFMDQLKKTVMKWLCEMRAIENVNGRKGIR